MNAVTRLLAAATTALLDPPVGAVARPSRTAGVGAVTDLVASWRFLVGSRLLLGATLVSAVLVAIAASLQTTVLSAYFLAAGVPALTGLTLGELAAGGIAGSALYAALAGRVRRRTWLLVGMLGFGTGFALVDSLTAPWLVLAAEALVGLTNAPVAPVAAAAGLDAAGLLPAALAAATAVAASTTPAFGRLDTHAVLEPPARHGDGPMPLPTPRSRERSTDAHTR